MTKLIVNNILTKKQTIISFKKKKKHHLKIVKNGKINGPIIGNQRDELIHAARKIILEKDT